MGRISTSDYLVFAFSKTQKNEVKEQIAIDP